MDWWSLLAQGISDTVNIGNQWITNAWNRKYQEKINRQNVDLLHQAWAREDTAVQRRAADMAAAGINPIMAAGAPASTMAPVKVDSVRHNAPQVAPEGLLHAMMVGAQLKHMESQNEHLDAQTIAIIDANNRENDLHAGRLTEQEKRINDLQVQIELHGANKLLAEKRLEAEKIGIELSNLDLLVKKIESEYAEDLMKAGIDKAELEVVALEALKDQREHDLKLAEYHGMPVGQAPTLRNVVGRGLSQVDRAARFVLDYIFIKPFRDTKAYLDARR